MRGTASLTLDYNSPHLNTIDKILYFAHERGCTQLYAGVHWYMVLYALTKNVQWESDWEG